MLKPFACLILASLVPLSTQAQQPAPAPLREERGNLILENIPAQDGALGGRLERYLHARQATFLDWLPNGGLLIATRFGNVEQVHKLTAPMGAREQLTFYEEPISAARAPQTGATADFVFLKDVGGNENAQLYLYRAVDRSVRLLTDGKSLHGSPLWSHDGKRVAFYGNGRDGVSYDIYVADITTNAAPRLVFAAQRDTWYPLDWSADDTRLLVQKYISINESELHVVDVATGTLIPATTNASRNKILSKRGNGSPTAASSLVPRAGITAAKFSPDGRGVYVATDQVGEFAQLRHVNLTTGEVREITAHVPWDIEELDVSADGRYIAYVANEDGRSRLTISDTIQRTDLILPALPQGLIRNVRFDRTGKKLALSVETAQAPRDVYVYDIEPNQLTRWTASEAGPVDTNAFVMPELVRYPTWDRVGGRQRTISAYVYKPKKAGPHPVLISIHGGPEAQYRPGFEAFTQFLVNELGYTVIAPNVRGSSGYGKTFLKLDNGMLREDAVRDIGSLLVWIGVQRDLDRERVVVMGGSYGGYMTLASLAAYSDRLRGGVDVVGISNFVSFLQNTSEYRRDLRRVEYGDERDSRMRGYLSRISPFNNATAIRRPLLVVQGMNDPRVPASESEQMVARIRASGGEVWYLAAKDEGHGFRKKPNRDFYLHTTASFLDKLTKSASP